MEAARAAQFIAKNGPPAASRVIVQIFGQVVLSATALSQQKDYALTLCRKPNLLQSRLHKCGPVSSCRLWKLPFQSLYLGNVPGNTANSNRFSGRISHWDPDTLKSSA